MSGYKETGPDQPAHVIHNANGSGATDKNLAVATVLPDNKVVPSEATDFIGSGADIGYMADARRLWPEEERHDLVVLPRKHNITGQRVDVVRDELVRLQEGDVVNLYVPQLSTTYTAKVSRLDDEGGRISVHVNMVDDLAAPTGFVGLFTIGETAIYAVIETPLGTFQIETGSNGEAVIYNSNQLYTNRGRSTDVVIRVPGKPKP